METVILREGESFETWLEKLASLVGREETMETFQEVYVCVLGQIKTRMASARTLEALREAKDQAKALRVLVLAEIRFVEALKTRAMVTDDEFFANVPAVEAG